jgi:anti-sigma regulatory factor (Ser/Thr protein kinase)
METFLIERWLRGADAAATTIDEASVAVARDVVRARAAEIGMSVEATAALVTATSELGHNQLRHARRGKIAVRRISRAGTAGLEVIAADAGDGIEDVETIVSTRAPNTSTTGAGLGIGLAGVVELADEVDFDVRLGEGSCVFARKFKEPVAYARRVALVGRPIDGEPRSGDDAAFVRLEDGSLVIALADGLGHGAEACAAARAAIACVLANAERESGALLADCHDALAKTRGAVMVIARLSLAGALDVSIVGNASARTVGRKSDVDRRYAGPSFALGSPGRLPRVRTEHDAVSAHEMLLLFSDGVSTRLAVDATSFAVPQVVAARRLLDAFSDRRDDALLALVR